METQKFSFSARQSSEEFEAQKFLSYTGERVQFERAPTRNRIGAQVDHIIYSRRCYYETMIIDAARMSFWLLLLTKSTMKMIHYYFFYYCGPHSCTYVY